MSRPVVVGAVVEVEFAVVVGAAVRTSGQVKRELAAVRLCGCGQAEGAAAAAAAAVASTDVDWPARELRLRTRKIVVTLTEPRL
jgi:hypothetical protein